MTTTHEARNDQGGLHPELSVFTQYRQQRTTESVRVHAVLVTAYREAAILNTEKVQVIATHPRPIFKARLRRNHKACDDEKGGVRNVSSRASLARKCRFRTLGCGIIEP